MMTRSRKPDALENSLDRPVTIRGAAENAKAGAVIVTDLDEAVYLEDLEEWPDDLLGKRIVAEGILRRRRIYPQIEIEDDVPSQGMSGEPWVLEFERYGVEG